MIVAGISGCIGFGNVEQKKTEARIRHYFGLASSKSMNSTNIQSALLLQFPVGTPSFRVEASLAERGVGKDGKSMMWRPETNKWWTGNSLCCGPNDYSDGFISMRRIQVVFNLDQQKVKAIEVFSFSYSF
jgi:hypothetical protein